MIYKFEFETEFVSLNKYINAERRNRYAGASIKKQQTLSIINALYQQNKINGKKIILDKKYVVSFTWELKNRRTDPDNISFAQKFILDGFVESGILKNDSFAHIKALEHNFRINKETKNTCIVEFIEVE